MKQNLPMILIDAHDTCLMFFFFFFGLELLVVDSVKVGVEYLDEADEAMS